MRDTFEGDDDLLRRYLLGELGEEETERLEPQLLEDDRLLEQMEAVEGDLLAEYAQGELTEEQEREVRKRLTATEEGKARLALAWNLHRIATEKRRVGEVIPMPQVSRRRASWYTPVAALAAALLLTVVGLSVWPQLQGRFGEHPPVEAGSNIGEVVIRTPTSDPAPPAEATPGQEAGQPATETQEVVEPTPETPEVTPSVELRPEPASVDLPLRSSQRSGDAPDLLRRTVPKEAEEVLFRVPLRDEGFTSYRAVLSRPDGSEEVIRDLTLQPLPSGKGIQFPVRAARVSEGLYRIEIFGVTPSGDDELVGDQELELQKR